MIPMPSLAVRKSLESALNWLQDEGVKLRGSEKREKGGREREEESSSSLFSLILSHYLSLSNPPLSPTPLSPSSLSLRHKGVKHFHVIYATSPSQYPALSASLLSLFSSSPLREVRICRKKGQNSFVAGILLVNVTCWIKENITSKVEGWIRRHKIDPIYHHASQPPLQLSIGNRFNHIEEWVDHSLGYLLPPQLAGKNLFLYKYPVQSKILHWNGPLKPWARDYGYFRDYWIPFACSLTSISSKRKRGMVSRAGDQREEREWL